VGRILRLMHESEILGRILPEFAPLTCLVQHEFFHRYTADEHTLGCLDQLDAMVGSKEPDLRKYAELYAKVEVPEILALAVLLHDTGKAELTRHHEEVGAANAAIVAKRFGFWGRELRQMTFLVDHHMTLGVFARKNLEEPETIRELARIVEDQERLDLLMLISAADVRAVAGKNNWSSWRELLVWDLYQKTKNMLTGEEEFLRGEERKQAERRQEVREVLAREFTEDEAGEHLERMGKEHDNPKEIWWKSCFDKIMSEKIYIPIGFQCTTAEILKKLNKRSTSFPFDWIVSTPNSIALLLSKLLNEDCNVDDFVKNEFLKIDSQLTFLKQEEFYTDINGEILFNKKYGLIFPHVKYTDETFLKFVKRFERLKKCILFGYNINFVFINRLVSNNNVEKDDSKINFSIDGATIQTDILSDLENLNKLLLSKIKEDRYKIIVINAVEKKNTNIIVDTNIRYYELVPINNNNLTDEEIIDLCYSNES
jgi:HD superfamily phosphodiesterase